MPDVRAKKNAKKAKSKNESKDRIDSMLDAGSGSTT